MAARVPVEKHNAGHINDEEDNAGYFVNVGDGNVGTPYLNKTIRRISRIFSKLFKCLMGATRNWMSSLPMGTANRTMRRILRVTSLPCGLLEIPSDNLSVALRSAKQRGEVTSREGPA